MIEGTLTINQTEVTGSLTVDQTEVTGTVQIIAPQITGVYGGSGTVPPSVINHISRTDNPHQVRVEQLPEGVDLILLFENALV